MAVFVYRVAPQDQVRREQPPVGLWAGPAPAAIAAAVMAARVLLLPRGLRGVVFRRDAVVPGSVWEACGDCRVGAAEALAGL